MANQSTIFTNALAGRRLTGKAAAPALRMLGKTSDRGPKLAALNSHPLQKTSNHFRAQNEARKNKAGPSCRAKQRACAIPLMPATLSFATAQRFLVFSLSLPLTLCLASLTQPGASAEIGTKETRAVQGRVVGTKWVNPSNLRI